MNSLLVRTWKMINGVWQWYILWLMHDKFIIGVSGVITDSQGRLLLLRHRYWKEGSWGLPSGYANRGEQLQDAIAREVNEETGYIIEVKRLVRLVSGFKLRIEVNYSGELVGGTLRVNPNEIVEARFFSPDALPDGLLDSHRQIIAIALPHILLDDPLR